MTRRTDAAMDVATINPSAHRDALMAAAGGPRDFAATGIALARWLTGRIGSDVTVSGLKVPVGAGIANETLLFDATYVADGERRTRGLVARVKPVSVQLFPDPDFDGLFRLLGTIGDRVKVPQPLFLEDDPGVIGAPFFVMTKVDGRTPVSQPPYNTTGWLAEADVGQRRTAWRTAIEGLASIHCVSGDLVAFLGWPRYGATGEEQQIGYWTHYADWSGVELPDRLVRLGTWVVANRPNVPGTFLSWGDARLGNMMFGSDFRLAAVLDWDQMSLADPRHDLAWWLFFDDQYSRGLGVPRLEGLGNREETIAVWEELSGHVAGDLGWYEAYVGYKVGLITMKTLTSSGQPRAAALALVDSFIERSRAVTGL